MTIQYTHFFSDMDTAYQAARRARDAGVEYRLINGNVAIFSTDDPAYREPAEEFAGHVILVTEDGGVIWQNDKLADQVGSVWLKKWRNSNGYIFFMHGLPAADLAIRSAHKAHLGTLRIGPVVIIEGWDLVTYDDFSVMGERGMNVHIADYKDVVCVARPGAELWVNSDYENRIYP